MIPVQSYIDALEPRILFDFEGIPKAAADNAADILQYLTKFEYESDAAKSSSLKLVVANPNFIFTEDKRLKAGIKFKFCWGYPSDMSQAQVVTITKAKPSFPSTGMPTIELMAFDLRYDLTAGSNPVNHGNISSSEVARRIAAKYGFYVDIEESGDASKRAKIQPVLMNDLTYLQSLAQKMFWACYLEGNVLHFHRYRMNQSPTLEFRYYNDDRSTIIDFSPEVNMNKPGGVKVVGATPKNSATVNVNGDNAESARKEGLSIINRLESNDRSRALADQNAKTIRAAYAPDAPKEVLNRLMIPTSERWDRTAQAQASGLAQKLDMAASKASMKVIGTPRLKANMMIRIVGVGSEYSGNWYITTAKHILSPTGTTYVTELKLTRNAPNAKKQDGKNKNSPTDEGGDSTLTGDVGYDKEQIARFDQGNIKSHYIGTGQVLMKRDGGWRPK